MQQKKAGGHDGEHGRHRPQQAAQDIGGHERFAFSA
jgi:hypothetical protein